MDEKRVVAAAILTGFIILSGVVFMKKNDFESCYSTFLPIIEQANKDADHINMAFAVRACSGSLQPN